MQIKKNNNVIFRILIFILFLLNNSTSSNIAFASDKCPTIRYNGIINDKKTTEEQLKIIQEASDCIGRENQDRVGKWVCIVQNVVGIQNQEKNTNSIYAGQIKPSADKFFFNIEKSPQDTKDFYCKRAFGTETMSLDDNPCIENFSAKSKNFFGVSVDGYTFNNKFEKFILFGTNDFIQFSTIGIEGSYITKGTCEKIEK